MFDMTRMRRRVGGIFVCAAAAVAAALGGHLLLLGTFICRKINSRSSERSDLDAPA